MESFDYIFFLVIISCIVVEAALSARENLGFYEPRDTLINFVMAIIGALVNAITKVVFLCCFTVVANHALFNPGEGVLSWIVLFLLIDLQFYLFHMLGHKSRFFWAMHVIHHSSHKYNFSTAIRAPFTNTFFRIASFLPLIWLGFSPKMVFWIDSIILFYVFFQHTKLISKLGWLEYIFNTPSHHRVHHGSNEKYLDKNFGGMLIIWDKLFGTFQQEEEEPTYGLTKPLQKTDLINVVVHEWKDIIHDLPKYSSWRDRHQVLFGRPGWKPKHGCFIIRFREKFFGSLLFRSLSVLLLSSLVLSTTQRKSSLTKDTDDKWQIVTAIRSHSKMEIN